MKTLMTLVSFLLAAGGATADVSKEEIRKLLAAGVSEDVILNYARQHAPMAKLSPEDVVELKNAGASDTLLKALLESTEVVPSAPPPSSSTYVTPGDTYVYDYSYSAPYTYYYPYFYSPYRFYYPPSFFRTVPRHHFFFPPRAVTPPRILRHHR